MSETSYASFSEFEAQHLARAPQHTRALHVQSFWDWYPPDRADVARRLARAAQHGMSLDQALGDYLPESFLASWALLKKAGVMVRRLVIVRGPNDPGYRPDFLRQKQALLGPLVMLGLENVRVAEFEAIETDVRAEAPACWPLQRYLEGLAQGEPTGSSGAWSVYSRRQVPKAHWLMSYVDGQPVPGPCFTPPYPEEIARHDTFWRDVFDQATPLLKAR